MCAAARCSKAAPGRCAEMNCRILSAFGLTPFHRQTHTKDTTSSRANLLFENGGRKMGGPTNVQQHNPRRFRLGQCSHHPVGGFCVAVESHPASWNGNLIYRAMMASRTTQLGSLVILADQRLQKLGLGIRTAPPELLTVFDPMPHGDAISGTLRMIRPRSPRDRETARRHLRAAHQHPSQPARSDALRQAAVDGGAKLSHRQASVLDPPDLPQARRDHPRPRLTLVLKKALDDRIAALGRFGSCRKSSPTKSRFRFQ